MLVVEDSRLRFGERTRWTIPNEHRCLSSCEWGACLIPRPARLDRIRYFEAEERSLICPRPNRWLTDNRVDDFRYDDYVVSTRMATDAR